MTDADALLVSLPQPIAVVGNGFTRRRHDAIEAHATVIRFNNYADVGHEQDVGHTIHVWCVTCCGGVRPRTWDHPVSVMTIATLMEQPTDIERWLQVYPDMAVPAESWIIPARELKGGNPSTGLTLIKRMHELGRRFTCFGFDGLRSGHYWDAGHAHHHWHEDELAALMELAKAGCEFA
jgi:hypothetical protein